MKTLGIIAACLVALIGGTIVLWELKYPTYTYRYRLTLALEVDGKVHTGSSVIEIIWKGGPEFGDVGPYHSNVRGQAAFVDLGVRGAVVATLINGEFYGPAPDGAMNALWLVPFAFQVRDSNYGLPELPCLTGRRELSPDNMPRLIWFSDINNPKTARKFLISEIPSLFGPTARLAAAYVEITRDPIVIDIGQKLPWYKAWADAYRKMGPIRLPNRTVVSRNMLVGDAS